MARAAQWRHLLCAATLAATAPGCTVAQEFYEYHGGGGSIEDAGPADHAPVITLMFVGPLQTDVGYPITLSGTVTDADGDRVQVRWLSSHGTIADPRVLDTVYECKKPGRDTITLVVSDGRKQENESVEVSCI